MRVDRRGPGAPQGQYPWLNELEPQRTPDVDQGLHEFSDMDLGVPRRRRDSQTFGSDVDRGIVDRLNVDRVAAHQEIARSLAALRIAHHHRDDVRGIVYHGQTRGAQRRWRSPPPSAAKSS